MNIIEYADREMLAIVVTNILAGALKNALLVNDTVSFAVPGGTTPGPIFDMLCRAELDWDRVHVMLTDERWVDETHDMSNTRLIRERLLNDQASRAAFVPYYRGNLSVDDVSAVVAPTLTAQIPLSLLVLGMGDDMHTASLFPDSEGLTAALAPDAPLLCPIKPPGQEIGRVTLPAHVLNGAMNKHLIIFGDEKRAALERAAVLQPETAPIAAVMDDLQVHWAA